MHIKIVRAIGYGRTKLSAFDNALHKAGISNYNLIPLSSVIPKGSIVIEEKSPKENKNYGNRLYVVISHYEVDEVGKEVWAGLGWTQAKDGSGLFVEHHANNKEKLKELIKNSLEDMKKYRDKEFGEIKSSTIGAVCEKGAVSVLVCAIYKEEPW